MRIFILSTFFLLHFLIPLKSGEVGNVSLLYSNNSFGEEYFGELINDFGEYKKELSSDEIICVEIKIYRKSINRTSQKSFGDDKKYGYTIVGVSNSKFRNQLTSTWLYGFWARVNGVVVTKAIWPTGKDIMVYTTPTKLFYFEEQVPNLKINVGWEQSIYEPKIIK